MQNPNKRVALVTGANRGLGLEICRQLAGAGLTVVLGARDVSMATGCCQRLEAAGGSLLPLRLDVDDDRAIGAAVQPPRSGGASARSCARLSRPICMARSSCRRWPYP